MTVIQARSIGEPLALWLEQCQTSRVIARFESTLQLLGEDDQVWGITVNANPGPFRMVVPLLPAWKLGTRVKCEPSGQTPHEASFLPPSRGALVGPGGALQWDADALWDPRPNRRPLNADERRTAMQQLAELIEGLNLPEVHGFWDSLAEAWDAFTDALRRQDASTLQAMLRQLIGQGPGLTPTGDDFAQAMLVTLRTGDDSDRAAFRTLASAITAYLPDTTLMSRSFLEEALHGWAFGPLKTLLEALPQVPSDAVRQ
ncbi:MAG: DUF2877 domain-containing protein, partial [Chloroflexi bacterium]|nr:DUF2877 domain-containing protein [Chloroflexota bacterium]